MRFTWAVKIAAEEKIASYTTVLQAPPVSFVKAADNGRVLLALYYDSGNLAEFGNAFQVWPILNSVLGRDWPRFLNEDADTVLVRPDFAAAPADSIPIEELKQSLNGNNQGWVIFDVTDALRPEDEGVDPTAFMLRWEREEINFKSELRLVKTNATSLAHKMHRPTWLLVKPNEGATSAVAQ